MGNKSTHISQKKIYKYPTGIRLIITNHQENVIQNHNETLFHPSKNGYDQND